MDPAVSAMLQASVGLDELAQDDFARVRDAIGDARVVLIGEETHGTQEFYALRAELTKALIEHEGFSLVLCESDFPTFYKLHRFVGGTRASRESLASSSSSSSSSSPRSMSPPPRASTPLLAADAKTSTPSYGATGTRTHTAEELGSPLGSPSPRVTAEEVMDVLKERFPVWMWRNEVVRDFVEWLQRENLRRALHKKTSGEDPPLVPVALFGLDIYSMFASTDQVVAYLDAVDPAMAAHARRRYAVLQAFRPHEQDYCHAVGSGCVAPQHSALARMVHELHDHAAEFKNVFGDGDEFFNAYENARVVLAAEAYYRQSYLGGDGDRPSVSWNIRDRAMAAMIQDALAFHDEKLQRLGHGNRRARAVVWAHNSHVGDGAATEWLPRHGQVNVGHLVREALGADACFLVGLTTATGSVRAARRWNGRDHVIALHKPLRDSVGDVLHEVANERAAKTGKNADASFGVVFRSHGTPLTPKQVSAARAMRRPRLERFIGVQYHRQQERQAHYAQCRLSEQFNLVVHVDATTALRPLAEPLASEPHAPPLVVDAASWAPAETVGTSKRENDAGAAVEREETAEDMAVAP